MVHGGGHLSRGGVGEIWAARARASARVRARVRVRVSARVRARVSATSC